MIVYKITNKIDGKIYIGQTTQELNKRWIQHKCDAKTRGRGHVLYRAIRKHGIENFEIKVIAYCSSIEEMNHREEYYIKLFKCLAPAGYNLALGGGNKRHTEESKRKLSLAKKGVKTGRTWNKGISPTKETKMKISIKSSGSGNGMFGKTHTPEVRKIISIAQTGRKHTPQEIQKRIEKQNKPILCHQNGIVFKSAKEAAEFCKITPQSVTQVAKRQRKQCKGYTFSYAEKDIKLNKK
jgi:group I intron endonuclease